MIEVKSLSRFYGEFAAVKSIDFEIQTREVVGFLGLNGAGKTTTLKVLAGLLTPSEGQIVIDGIHQEKATKAFRANIGFLPEETPLYQEMTVSEFLSYLGKMRGMGSAAVKARLPEVIEKCQLKGKEQSVIAELSLGFRKRVGIAQAIIHQPKLVILDEPISGLDPFQRVEMRDLVKSLAQEATVLLSSHNLREISETCDRILVMDNGEIIAKGTTEELMMRLKEGTRKLDALLIGEVDTIKTVLESTEGIASHTIKSSSDDVVNCVIEWRDQQTEMLTKTLVEKGIGVRSISGGSDSLEAVFLSLTQGGEA